QVEPHDDVFVAVDLLDLGRIGLVRQVVEDARDAVAYIVCRRIDVAVDLELDGHDRTAILAHRLHETHAFDAGDAVLDHLRDATLDYARGSAPIIGFDRYHGRIDVGIFAQRQAVERDQAKGDQQQRQYGGKDRPPYR